MSKVITHTYYSYLFYVMLGEVKEYSTKAYYIQYFVIKSMFILLFSTTIKIFRRPIKHPLLGGRDSFAHFLCMCKLGRGSESTGRDAA